MTVIFLTSAEFWADQLVNGLTTGSIYALIALGYTMVYGVLQLINFAHGEVFMIGSFAGYGVLVAMGGDDTSGAMIALALVLAMIAASAASMGTALAIERIAYRPLRNAPRLAPLISAIGVSVFLSHLVDDGFLTGRSKYYPSIFPDGALELGPLTISALQIFLMGSSLAMMGGLWWVIQRTKLGRGIRAVAESRDNASLMGIDVNRAIVVTFALGAIMAGVAGVLYGLFYSAIRGSMGFIPGVKAFTAAVLGGIGSVQGAVIGGYFLGLTETVGRELLNEIPGVSLPNQWKDVVAFSLLVLVLIFRPNGIFGQKETKRA
ncbi:MAG: branched-chain amino acid ABC transporter permease [Dehalococcoidia bacterium]|uniref:branched-chain amino acid ABC transporter permease n=1 Tax=Candidatus Amarobacter glycogenicus TaxID=3140699 RepID=UPI002A1471CF|nr:branched-chain amino acid ABC transporter permease [Dehalococcoidia bacterium]MBK6560858.1 branched-chain amino acid ABC transporter permease [Dehalococcoidia bacterium]MBK7125565.1 branched-chain amino acid ABC transporter permease [Dehalococcoidia bacterium]MBK8559137.1 branched-chain amino acid ABC transporter permease [Dehalococcoidia bacterium]MBK9344793.1 branched-chain amino acid ABC transporter permease [Dehalococcoidia bacterium]